MARFRKWVNYVAVVCIAIMLMKQFIMSSREFKAAIGAVKSADDASTSGDLGRPVVVRDSSTNSTVADGGARWISSSGITEGNSSHWRNSRSSISNATRDATSSSVLGNYSTFESVKTESSTETVRGVARNAAEKVTSNSSFSTTATNAADTPATTGKTSLTDVPVITNGTSSAFIVGNQSFSPSDSSKRQNSISSASSGSTYPTSSVASSIIANNYLLTHSNSDNVPHRDVLCYNCRKRKTHKSQTCFDLLKKYLIHRHGEQYDYNATSLLNAVDYLLRKNSSTFSENCQRCHPDSCPEQEKDYYRFDHAFTPVIHHATTLALHSIPPNNRVPPEEMSRNLTEYFSNQSHVHPAKTYFFEYNPSLVQIPEGQVPPHLQSLSGDDRPVYLASFRVTNMQQCIYGDQEFQMIGGKWPRPKQHNYLGLALLRRDLSIIEDVVLKFLYPYVQDFRIFNIHGQLYLTGEKYIIPFWLVPPSTDHYIGKNQTRQESWKLIDVTQVYPSNLTVKTRPFNSCLNNNGKNINYFVDARTNETLAEIYPMAGKDVVDLDEDCRGKKGQTDQEKKEASKKARKPTNETKPMRSFGSHEELHFAKGNGHYHVVTAERGSACCVRIPDPTRNSTFLYLGISHSKTKFVSKETRNSLPGNVSANHFFSSLYAFEPYEPYTVRALSGKFCLGFPTEEEGLVNPYSLNNRGPLWIGGPFDCPAIHFVSGIVEKVGDPNRVIIAYGVSDCSPRFIEVSKEDLSRMLFPWHYQRTQMEANFTPTLAVATSR